MKIVRLIALATLAGSCLLSIREGFAESEKKQGADAVVDEIVPTSTSVAEEATPAPKGAGEGANSEEEEDYQELEEFEE